jgi:hypothetical protein
MRLRVGFMTPQRTSSFISCSFGQHSVGLHAARVEVTIMHSRESVSFCIYDSEPAFNVVTSNDYQQRTAFECID